MAKLIRLNDGTRLFHKKSTSGKAFALGVFVGAGCVYENRENNGIAHFIEHMAFKGTEKRTAFDIANETERHGIAINAFTSRTYTAFYTIGLIEYADVCADILSDMMFNSTFDEESLKKEQEVVVEEINMYEDDNEDLCLENLIRAHYGKKMLAAPILGTKKNVRSFDKEKIQAFMKDFYRSENTCVAVVGNISEEQAVSLVNKYFVKKATAEAFVRPKVRAVKPQAKYIEKIKPVEQSCVGIAFPSYPYRHKLNDAPLLISSVLGGGMSSRLFQDVREKNGLVYEIYATSSQYETNGYFIVYFATGPSRVRVALEKVRECLLNALQTGITAEELDKAVATAKTGYALGGESASGVMRLGGSYGLIGKLVTYEKLIKKLSKITLDDINFALKNILDFSQCSISYVGQKQDFDIYKLFTEGKYE